MQADQPIISYITNCCIHSNPQVTFEEIKRCRPNKIILNCSMEPGHDLYFGELILHLVPWIQGTQIELTVITACPEEGLLSQYKLEDTYGYLFNFIYYFFDWRPGEHDKTTLQIFPNMRLVAQRANAEMFYTCFNHRNRLHRSKVVDLLAKNNLLNRGKITYHHPQNHDESDINYYKWQWHDGSPLLLSQEALFQPYASYNATPVSTPPTVQHFGFMDLVTETCPDLLFVTEKTFKSIFLFKPFLVVGGKDFHTHLTEKFGLELYTEIFDYSFDSANTIDERINGVIDNVVRISQMNDAQLHKAYRLVLEKLVHNKQKLLEIFFDRNRIVPQSLHFLFQPGYKIIYGPGTPILKHIQKMEWGSWKHIL
jgi:hypothetical protein